MRTRPDIRRLDVRLGGRPLTRFAPSPTGYLHLGHVVNAIYVWGIARALGGQVLLRIEDHDRVRSRSVFEAALVEDLAWLGFEPDAGLEPLVRQSDEMPAYEQALARLRQSSHVYACRCSRKDIVGERYPGTCRDLGLPEAPGAGLRVQLDDRRVRVEDALLGPLEQVPADQCGDLLLRDRDGHWTYQFAVTVDDFRHGVTLVIRGADLVSSTGRQIQLAQMLGRPQPPIFLHHPILRADSGEKLSKANRDAGVRDLRAAGLEPPQVIGRAAAAAGLIDHEYPVPASAVSTLFGGCCV